MRPRAPHGPAGFGVFTHDPRAMVALISDELAEAVDLIVVPGVRERLELGTKCIQPWRLTGQQQVAGLDLGEITDKPLFLGTIGPHHDWTAAACGPELLVERDTAARIFDHDTVSLPLPEILPIARIEPGIGAIVPVAREVPCGHGYIDNLFVTGDGEIVVAEAKLWANPQARREVVAQALDYIAALTQMSYETFEEAISKSPSGPKTFYACVADLPDALSEAEFVDAVSHNLAHGRILVLVVGDGIRSQAEALTDLLQSHAGAHFTFALVELATWREAHTGKLLVIPDVLARTVMIERGIVRLQGGGMEVLPPPAATSARPSTMTEEMFYEQLGIRNPLLGQHVREFLDLVEPLGVYPEFKASLNLKADLAESTRAFNFGYITKEGKLWTDALSWTAPGPVAMAYNQTLAELIGGSVVVRESAQSYVSSNGKSAPYIDALLPQFAASRVGAIETAIEAIRADRDQNAD